MKKYPHNTHVKPDLCFRVPTKRLDNLPSVVTNWLQTHEYFDFTYDKVTGKKLLFVLYYALRSREFDLRNKEKYICDLVDRNNQLQKDKTNLENELKSYRYANYTFNVIRVEWDCGDGCCSDSWYIYKVLDGNGNQVDSGGGQYFSQNDIEETLKEKYGPAITFDYYVRDHDEDNLREDWNLT